MKKIGIDARLYFQTGVGTYIRNLLHNLQRLAPSDLLFYIYLLPEDSKKISFTAPQFVKRKVPYLWHSFAEQIGFYSELQKDKLDLMHFTYYSYPILYRRPFISTVHDTIIYRFKTGNASTRHPFIYELKHAAFRLSFSSQVKYASAIITPTETVKRELLEMFGKQYEKKISVTYEGIDSGLSDVVENSDLRTQFNNDFFLYVGNFYPHKNVERLIEAFKKYDGKEKLVLVGPSNYFSDRMKRNIKSTQLENKLVFFHDAKSSDLVYFYKNARALISPSLSEGFGLPLVEATCFGLPLIASNIPVFKELFGEQYLAFDPYNVEDIAAKLQVFHDEKQHLLATSHIKELSFGKMTTQTLDLYKKLCTV